MSKELYNAACVAPDPTHVYLTDNPLPVVVSSQLPKSTKPASGEIARTGTFDSVRAFRINRYDLT